MEVCEMSIGISEFNLIPVPANCKMVENLENRLYPPLLTINTQRLFAHEWSCKFSTILQFTVIGLSYWTRHCPA